MAGPKAFFDTTVLLSMYGGEAGKQARAKELFQQHVRAGQLLLSTQVVQEFYAAGSRRLQMPRSVLREMIPALLDLPLIFVEPPHITSAIQKEERYQISFRDALILTAAESGGAELLYTEDLNDGQQYGDVLVRNPFVAEW